MDLRELGGRILRARELKGSSQAALAEKVGLDRSAISRIEQGDRKVAVNELLVIAEALGRPLSFFVAPAVPAVVSRRSSPGDTHESSLLLDEELRLFASDVEEMLAARVVKGVRRSDIAIAHHYNHEEAERSANDIRTRAGLDRLEPVRELSVLCEHLGLVTFATTLTQNGPDGACVEVGEDGNQLGAAVINGDSKPGRQRMTLAHELGHWVCGDAYDHAAPANSESYVNSFAIHLLAPRAGVQKVWTEHSSRTQRHRAIVVCSQFRLSWSAGLGQLRNLGLMSTSEVIAAKDVLPRPGEFALLGLPRNDEPAASWLSPGYTAKVLDAYMAGLLTAERTVELLKNTIDQDELPPVAALTIEQLWEPVVGNPA